MPATRTLYTVRAATETEAEGESEWWMVLDQDGDVYDGYATATEALAEASALNTNLKIEASIEALSDQLDYLTTSRKPAVLAALKDMIATAARLAEAE